MNDVYTPAVFEPMWKIPRLNKKVIITEKIDGTSAQIAIQHVPFQQITNGEHNECGPIMPLEENVLAVKVLESGDHLLLRAGSKNRFLTIAKDNFNFAQWVLDNAQELFELGEGIHRGEWWGRGIGRNYGLTDRRFSLFNVSRWAAQNDEFRPPLDIGQGYAPKCCHVVPMLGVGEGLDGACAGLQLLVENGSQAARGFMKPEGIVVFHSAADLCFKATIEHDTGKWEDLTPVPSEMVQ